MGDIIDFPDKGTFGEVPVEEVLKGSQRLQMVTIMGYDQDGNEYFASSSGDIQEVYWLLGRFRKFLEEIGDESESNAGSV
jgi:hypothetical protein